MKKDVLTIFSNDEFGKVRTTIIDHEPWFVAMDVANALGFTNSRKAVADHVDDEDKGVTKCYTLGGEQKMTIINESGLYALIFGSHLPKARAFKRWVTADVLPTLRKKGYYAIKPKKDDGWDKKMEKRTKDFIEYWFMETVDYYRHVVGITNVAPLPDYMLNELYCAHANRLDHAICEFMSFTRAHFRAVVADPTLLMPVKERNKLLRKQGRL